MKPYEPRWLRSLINYQLERNKMTTKIDKQLVLASKLIDEASKVAKEVLRKAEMTAQGVIETASGIAKKNDKFAEEWATHTARSARVEEIVTELRDAVRIQNGRVGKLESWRAYTTGAIAIITFIILPVIGFLAVRIIDLGNQVSSNSALIKSK